MADWPLPIGEQGAGGAGAAELHADAEEERADEQPEPDRRQRGHRGHARRTTPGWQDRREQRAGHGEHQHVGAQAPALADGDQLPPRGGEAEAAVEQHEAERQAEREQDRRGPGRSARKITPPRSRAPAEAARTTPAWGGVSVSGGGTAASASLGGSRPAGAVRDMVFLSGVRECHGALDAGRGPDRGDGAAGEPRDLGLVARGHRPCAAGMRRGRRRTAGWPRPRRPARHARRRTPERWAPVRAGTSRARLPNSARPASRMSKSSGSTAPAVESTTPGDSSHGASQVPSVRIGCCRSGSAVTRPSSRAAVGPPARARAGRCGRRAPLRVDHLDALLDGGRAARRRRPRRCGPSRRASTASWAHPALCERADHRRGARPRRGGEARRPGTPARGPPPASDRRGGRGQALRSVGTRPDRDRPARSPVSTANGTRWPGPVRDEHRAGARGQVDDGAQAVRPGPGTGAGRACPRSSPPAPASLGCHGAVPPARVASTRTRLRPGRGGRDRHRERASGRA